VRGESFGCARAELGERWSKAWVNQRTIILLNFNEVSRLGELSLVCVNFMICVWSCAIIISIENRIVWILDYDALCLWIGLVVIGSKTVLVICMKGELMVLIFGGLLMIECSNSGISHDQKSCFWCCLPSPCVRSDWVMFGIGFGWIECVNREETLQVSPKRVHLV